MVGLIGYSLVAVWQSWVACNRERWAFKQVPQYYVLGAFVYADAFIFGIFWALVGGVILWFQDWLLFGLIWALFWLIRSVGETIYWFNEQFAQTPRNPHHTLPWNGLFHDGSVWFVYQIVNQCVSVVAAVLVIYFGVLWVRSI